MFVFVMVVCCGFCQNVVIFIIHLFFINILFYCYSTMMLASLSGSFFKESLWDSFPNSIIYQAKINHR